MKRIKEILDFIKEKLQNRRTRAITLLSLYFIFFAFLILLLKIGDTYKSPEQILTTDKSIEDKYTNLSTNYSYKYNIEIQTAKEVNIYQINGRYINNETDYTISKLVNKEYQIINDFELINEKMLYIENIFKYIGNKEYEYQTKYKNGTILENYKVPIKEIDEYNSLEEVIEINVESKDDFIYKISFDSSKVDQLLNKDILISKYILEYEKKD